MANAVNVPSYNSLLSKDRIIKSIMDLYWHVKDIEEGGVTPIVIEPVSSATEMWT